MPRNVRCLAAIRVLPLALAASTLLVACGAPPEPPLTAPPGVSGLPSVSGSGYPVPTLTALPTGPVPTYPTGGLPGYPTAGLPAYPTATTTPPTTATTPPATATTSPPPSAPKCTNGPTPEQVLAVVKQRPGMPEAELKIIDGPYCAGTWQFSTVEIAVPDAEEQYEPLFVVSNGKPATLKVIEAGADVCSLKVRTEAPAGIRVRACGG